MYKSSRNGNYFANYLKTYLERDVSKLANVRDLSKFENLLRVLASLTGEEFVADNVAKTVGVDKNTVSSWTGILQASGIVTLLPPYYEESMNKRIVKRKKIYFNDTGFACYLIGIDTPKTLRLSAFRGRLVETYIHNEIRKSYVNFGLDDRNMFYYRDNNQNEIDLILLRDGAQERIECKSFTSKDIKGFAQMSQTSFDRARRLLHHLPLRGTLPHRPEHLRLPHPLHIVSRHKMPRQKAKREWRFRLVFIISDLQMWLFCVFSPLDRIPKAQIMTQS